MSEVTEKIIDALAERGFYVGASIFDAALTARLEARARVLSEARAFDAARVGRAAQASRAHAIRGDQTRWLDDSPSDPAEQAASTAVRALRQSLNASLFLGAHSHELHFAHYAAGASYKTHRDRFADDDARLISLVFYLNDVWPRDAGGELAIYGDAMQPIARVLPRAGTMVAFRSERFPHEVLPATQDRFSLTGWLRRSNVAS
jgi:SM-20-related protein